MTNKSYSPIIPFKLLLQLLITIITVYIKLCFEKLSATVWSNCMPYFIMKINKLKTLFLKNLYCFAIIMLY